MVKNSDISEDETVQSLGKVLESEPWFTLKALADRLEEMGESGRSGAMRMLIASKRIPYYSLRTFRYGWAWSDSPMPPPKSTMPYFYPCEPQKIPFPSWLYGTYFRQRSFDTILDAYLYAAEVIAAGWLEIPKESSPES